MQIKRLLRFWILAILTISTAGFAKSRDTFLGARAMGMGGANMANASDWSAILVNPAAMDLYMDHMNLSANFGTYLSPSILDLASFMAGNSKKLTSPDGLKSLDQGFYDDLYSIDGKWSTFGMVPNAGFMARTFGYTYGFAGYWDIPTRVMLESGVLVPKIFLGTQADLSLVGSIAKRYNKIFSLGGSFKWMRRVLVDDIALNYTETLEFADRFKKSKLSALDPYTTVQEGAGFDAGSLIHMGAMRMGVSVQDLATYLGGEFLSPRLNMGLAYKILPAMEYEYIKDMTATFELDDAFRNSNFFTKVSGGFETKFHNFDLRAGLHQGYPTFGGTMYFMIFHLDYLYYTKELGLFVNEAPLSYHFIQGGINIEF